MQILSIVDDETGQEVAVDITVRQDDIMPGEDGQVFRKVYAPIVIPIEVGKCSYMLIEASGYYDWEEAFCPTHSISLSVDIRLGKSVEDKQLPQIQGVSLRFHSLNMLLNSASLSSLHLHHRTYCGIPADLLPFILVLHRL